MSHSTVVPLSLANWPTVGSVRVTSFTPAYGQSIFRQKVFNLRREGEFLRISLKATDRDLLKTPGSGQQFGPGLADELPGRGNGGGHGRGPRAWLGW